MARDPFIIDTADLPDDTDNRCETCCGTGYLHKNPTYGWDSCLALEVGGRCCDWKGKYCPDCEGLGKTKVATKT